MLQCHSEWLSSFYAMYECSHAVVTIQAAYYINSGQLPYLICFQTEPFHQSLLIIVSSPLAYADQMASDLMVVPLPHGSLASVLFGTLLVWTPLQPHTCLMPQGKLEL